MVSAEHRTAIQEAGYHAAAAGHVLTVAKHVEMRVTGSIFGGRGAVLGVTPDTFAQEEQVKNALVR